MYRGGSFCWGLNLGSDYAVHLANFDLLLHYWQIILVDAHFANQCRQFSMLKWTSILSFILKVNGSCTWAKCKPNLTNSRSNVFRFRPQIVISLFQILNRNRDWFLSRTPCLSMLRGNVSNSHVQRMLQMRTRIDMQGWLSHCKIWVLVETEERESQTSLHRLY